MKQMIPSALTLARSVCLMQLRPMVVMVLKPRHLVLLFAIQSNPRES